MIASLPALVTIWLSLHACNQIAIRRMNNDHLDLEAVALVISAANAAHEGAQCANQAIHNIAPIQFIPCLKKGDARANTNQNQVKEHITKIQAKKNSIFPDAPRQKQMLFSMMAIAGAIHNIWTHAAKLVLCAIGIHIALNQPHCVIGNDMLKLATAILGNTIVIQNKNELEDLLKYKLQYPTPTIDELPGNNITDTLDAILKSAHAAIEKIDTINKIDADYLEMDDVFFQCNTTDNTRDSLVSLYNQAFTAFKEANNTNQAFQNAWNPIMNLTHCPLAALQQPFDATIKARDATKNASNAYCALVKYFVDYFSQFTVSIQTMLNSCSAWFTPTIQKTLRSCDQCVNVTQAKLGDKTVPLGVDLKAVQEVVDKLNEAIKQSYDGVQKNCNSVNNAIEEAHKTAELYTTCYKQYKNIVNAIHIVSIAPQPDQTNKTA